MTDFRRPDLDLWDEEDDGEDARPTIVAERPSEADRPRSVFAAPNASRSSLVKRLIEQGALEDEPPRPSAENLRDSEVDQLTLVESQSPMELAAARASLLDVESEPPTEDTVPTVSVKRQLLSANTPLPAPMPNLTLPPPRSTTDREVTERISIPMGMAGSIAPASKTFRPEKRSGMPFWQTALAAVVLLGGGLSIAKLRNERKAEISSASMQAPRQAEPAAEAVSPSPEPARTAIADAPLPAPVVPPPAAVEPPPLVPVLPRPEPLPTRTTPDSSTSRRARRAERTALATSAAPAATPSAAPSEPTPIAIEPVAKPIAAPAPQNLPAQPSREQVTAALSAVVPALRKCVGDRHDTADVTLTVRPAGFVSYAVVSGTYAGSSEGSCIARAVKAAKFPAFSDPSLRVSYPFQL